MAMDMNTLGQSQKRIRVRYFVDERSLGHEDIDWPHSCTQQIDDTSVECQNAVSLQETDRNQLRE